MLRTASSLPPTGLSTLGFDPPGFPTEPPACYRASWQLPGPDSHRQATTSLRTRGSTAQHTASPPALLGARSNDVIQWPPRATVKLGGRPFGELRPALALRDDVRENGGALDDVRALPTKRSTSRAAAAPVGRWDILLGQRRVPPYAARRRFTSSGRPKDKARRSHSLPLSTYSALGGLPQDPGRAAESSAGPRTDEDMGHDVRVLLSTHGGRGDVEPLVGPAVRLRALGAEVRVCAPPDWAERLADASEGRQPEMRTCPTRGSTELEAPVIRSAGAGQRSTAASEVSR